jgi:hypothetical protein
LAAAFRSALPTWRCVKCSLDRSAPTTSSPRDEPRLYGSTCSRQPRRRAAVKPRSRRT